MKPTTVNYLSLFKHSLTITMLTSAVLLTSNSYADQAATILLHQCKPTPNQIRGMVRATPLPFYCAYIGGDALKQPLEVRFDSASNAASIPMDCLNPDNIKIVKTGVKDQWGYPSNIVQGNISMGSYRPKQDKFTGIATLNNFQFFALTNVSCEKGFKNFGGAMNLFKKQFKQAPKASYCVGSFFSMYFAANRNLDGYLLKQGPTPYFTQLILGSRAANLSAKLNYQLSSSIVPMCGGQSNVPSHANPFSKIPTVPNFFIKINGINVPSTNTRQSGKLAMIDTGGGMAIIADDNKQTITKALNQQQTLVSPSWCPRNVRWLHNCGCLKPNTSIEISSPQYNVDYTYQSSDTRVDQRRALAVCPPFKRGSSNTYITPNGINVGYELFQQVDVGFDYKNGTIYFTKQ